MTALRNAQACRGGLRRYLQAAILAAGLGALLLGNISEADPLDPAAFSSLGPSPFDAGGQFVIDTSVPQLTGGNPPIPPITGVVTPDNVAVFAFDSVSIPSGATISAVGSRPLALLSHTSVLILGRIGLSAGGGAGADGSGRDAGGGPGGGGAPSNEVGGGGGGGFGGAGGAAAGSGAGVGGSVYGNPQTRLEGGSGGGGGDGGPGGQGGGAIELGAADQMVLAGEIHANGAPSPTNNFFDPTVAGGGGSGGGILLHAPSLIVDGVLSVKGGDGGLSGLIDAGGGGGGGGGRVVILAALDGLTLHPGLDVSLGGGAGGVGGNSGLNGVAGGSGSLVTGLLPGASPAPVVAGCIKVQGAPLVGAPVKLKQGRTQSAVTDGAGCFSFSTVITGRAGSIIVELPTLP